MSRGPRYRWWGYAKNNIRAYPDLKRRVDAAKKSGKAISNLPWDDLRDLEAVERAVAATLYMPDGPLRVDMIEKVYWKKSHTLNGAAMLCHVSYATAKRWHGEFVRAVARELKLIR